MKKVYFILLSLSLTCFCQHAAAQNYYKYEQSLEGTGFAADSTDSVSDPLYAYSAYTLPGYMRDYEVEDVISLNINDNESVYFPDSFTCQVMIALTEYDSAGNRFTENKVLYVSYNRRNLAHDTLLSYYRFKDKYVVKDSILSIVATGFLGGTLPDIFQLTNSIQIHRLFYVAICLPTFVSSLNITHLGTEDELLVTWQTPFPSTDSIYSYDQFDLEWTFYDDSSVLIKNGGGGGFGGPVPYNSSLFRNNATRVEVRENSYQIPELYENGWLIVRVRPVKVLENNQKVPSTWTSDAPYVLSGGSNAFYPLTGHQDSINWQAKTSFAEEGKRKSVVSYFDGASKNRQTVTKITTDTMAVVAQTIYDYEGRPVANTLPTPAFAQAIQYFDKFNQNMGDSAYTWPDLDSSGSCNAAPRVMNTISGSSRYYSVNNPLKTYGFNRYIPNAFGYPFSQQEYTGDLTGRITRSAGPGFVHHMGNSYVTQNMYGAPMQSELYRLFGTEVGVASHYFKNAVIDPNGQTTITYTDMHGRTVATSLYGLSAFATMDTVCDYRGDTVLKDGLIDSVDNQPMGSSIVCSKSFMALTTPLAPYTFVYSCPALTYTAYDCDSTPYCFPCIYDLNITISKDCFNAGLPFDTAITSSAKNYIYNSSTAQDFFGVCPPNGIYDSFQVGLPMGSYTYTKTLTVTPQAIDTFYARYIAEDTCIKTFNYFYNADLSALDMSGCNITCASCQAAIGDSLSYIHKFLVSIAGVDSTNTTTQDTLNAVSAYQQLESYCSTICGTTSLCSQNEGMMLGDMSPGGQYAYFDSVYNINDGSDPTSIFYAGSNSYYAWVQTNLKPLYTDPAIVYQNSYGVNDTLVIDTNGSGNLVTVLPNALNLKNFIAQWKPSWAKALLPFHPEYCFYEFCIANTASNTYDANMLSVSDYATASSQGFNNPLNDPACSCGSNTTNEDPFFVGGLGAAYQSEMMADMETYFDTGSGMGLSAWQLAMLSLCTGSSCPNPGCGSNYYWISLRAMYQGLKATFVDMVEQAWVTNTANCNLPYPDFSDDGPLAGKQARFVLASDSFWSPGTTDTNVILSDGAAILTADSLNYGNECSSYASYWWSQLSLCYIPEADSVTIINELIAVCRLGSDANHPYGASSDPSGTHTMNGNSSFEEVLQWAGHLTTLPVPWTYNSSDTCTSLLISNPLPYSNQPEYFQSAIFMVPDSCTCAKISSFYAQYQASGTTDSFSTYLANNFNIVSTQSDAMALVNGCANSSTCQFLNHPVSLPYQFSCNETCVACWQVTQAYNSFMSEFPGVRNSQNYLSLLQTYLNSALNLNLNAIAYLDFMNDSCHRNGYSSNADSGLTVTDTMLGPISDISSPHCDSLDTMVNNLLVIISGYPRIWLSPTSAWFDMPPDVFAFDMNMQSGNSLDGLTWMAVLGGCGISVPINLAFSANMCDSMQGGPYLCNQPLFPNIGGASDDTCLMIMQQYAYHNASSDYSYYIKNVHQNFVNGYIAQCLSIDTLERDSFVYPSGEYHFTLYYYDQAGNLVQTVPPAGFDTTWNANHIMKTRYAYNTYNQVTEQITPDAGRSYYWYDLISKLTFSRNYKQFLQNQLSYTVYDPLTRIIEVGQANVSSTSYNNYSSLDNLLTLPLISPGYNWYTNVSYFTTPNSLQQVTHTYYDIDYLNISPHFGYGGMQNLRNRVASIIYTDTLTSDSSHYNTATHYSYDPDGNVQTLLQENRMLKPVNQDFKRFDYQYDLISGKVNAVMYQRCKPDAWYHMYEYDADNRLTDVWTSRDSVFFDHDAFYQYYLHGPLARAVIGQKQVQGLDYAYTIQGWLKAVNGWWPATPDSAFDIGQDGDPSSANSLVAIDQYGFALGYYDSLSIPNFTDYSAISLLTVDASPNFMRNLFNGNISYQSTNIVQFNQPINYFYHYDQLNRLTAMNVVEPVGVGTTTDYNEKVSYDPNGNIVSYIRNGFSTGGSPLGMDSLTYSYQPGHNRLDHVNDAVSAANYSVDIDNEDTLNYRYDQIGNLTKDTAGGLDSIYWSVYGKIREIDKYDGDTIRFAYDPAGNRVLKAVFKDTANIWTKTYYTHDAQGNIMSTYQWLNNDTFNLDELVIYGSSRLGTIGFNQYLTDTINRDSAYYAEYPPLSNPLDSDDVYYTDGLKQYELTNHLGNVLATLTDRHIPQYNNPYGGTFVNYHAEVASAQDYYPFGMIMPGRSYLSSVYQFGFNKGGLKDDEITAPGSTYSTFFRELDTRLDRWWAIDPLTSKSVSESPYTSMSNNPILLNDALGNIVSYKKDEDVSRKEYKAAKKEFKELRKNSETFNGMYKAAQKSKETYTIDIHNKEYKDENGKIQTGGDYEPSTKTINITRQVAPEDMQYGTSDNAKLSRLIINSHEFGHLERDRLGLDPPELEAPQHLQGESSQAFFARSDAFKVAATTRRAAVEKGASQIENTVRGELINSGYKIQGLNPEYKFGGYQWKEINGRQVAFPTVIHIDLLK
jgi:hypothetical protein